MENFAIYKSKYGLLKIAYEDNMLIYIKKVHVDVFDFGKEDKFLNNIFSQLNQYFEGSRKSFDLKFKMYGTDFQKKVWKALCDIPYGETRSYKDIAIAVGNEKACRAVGLANNKNPISIIVPCHRVIGSSGKLVGYAGGLDMKKELLELEKKYK